MSDLGTIERSRASETDRGERLTPSSAPAAGEKPAIVPAGAGPTIQLNAMTVDVEDYFQVGAFTSIIKPVDWDRFEARVERNTERTLQIFADCGAQATFFTLGWVAERYPQLIRRIVEAGHEIASHGCSHIRVDHQTEDEFREDARASRRVLEDISGVAVQGYRAASFSIGQTTPWAHRVLAEEGYLYSSSINPISHDHYGMPDAPRFPFRPAGDEGVIEYPMTTVRLFGRNLPCSGGGYFRLVPYGVFKFAISRFNRVDNGPAIFYFHPWEVDPDQPRIEGASAKARFRHYLNLDRMESRLRTLLADFRWGRMDRVFKAS
jgi:polysaccharide deacetylase family protein (PEP-CTERM system associated)